MFTVPSSGSLRVCARVRVLFGKALEGDGVPDWADKKPGEDDNAEEQQNESQEIFAPNHYCVHHGGVERNGKIEMAEAVSHNYNKRLGRVTHYDMKFSDGVIKENVAFEDIQVTNASLAKEHRHAVGKRDDKEKCPKCNKSPCICDDRPMEEAKLRRAVREALKKSIVKR